jgi:hypothetical protein
MSASLYGQVNSALWSGSLNFASDTIKGALVGSAYTPDFTAHQFFSSITNEVTGTGYTAGGATLASKTSTFTAANSWATTRANSTAYALGAIVRPATGNGYLYQAVVAGTSGASIPTYPTVVGQTVTDGGVTWVCKGRSVLVLDCADLTWPGSTITPRGIVIYKSTGTASTSPLIAYDTTGADVPTTNGTLTYTVDPVGLVVVFAD